MASMKMCKPTQETGHCGANHVVAPQQGQPCGPYGPNQSMAAVGQGRLGGPCGPNHAMTPGKVHHCGANQAMAPGQVQHGGSCGPNRAMAPGQGHPCGPKQAMGPGQGRLGGPNQAMALGQGFTPEKKHYFWHRQHNEQTHGSRHGGHGKLTQCFGGPKPHASSHGAFSRNETDEIDVVCVTKTEEHMIYVHHNNKMTANKSNHCNDSDSSDSESDNEGRQRKMNC